MNPVRLEIEDKIEDSIFHIKENLRLIPYKGIGYGAIMGYKMEVLPKISFNYLGKFDEIKVAQASSSISHYLSSNQSSWELIDEDSGEMISALNKDKNILNITAIIINGRLKFFV
jgi:non-ribosomal peptide synthase protein (TIGR01720 family)